MNKLKIMMANMPIVNNGNKGCIALSISALFLIKEALERYSLEYEFYMPDSGHLTNGRYSYDIDGTEIEYYACGHADWYNLKTFLKQVALWAFKNKEYSTNLRAFKNADYIFDIGQGDSFSDIYGKERFNFIDKIHKIAQKRKIPYCILPQTIGPFKDEIIKHQAVESINKSSVVMARDFQSLTFVKENCPNKEVEEYIDVAFFMPYKKQTFSNQFVHVGINISSLLWHGGYTRNNQFELKVDYQKLIVNVIDYFLSFPDVKLHLVSHVVATDSDIENDYEVSYHLVNNYASERIVLAPLFLSPIYAKNYISGMDFFLGARMHATIAAFSSGVPVFPMAYSRKFNGLFMDTLSYPYMGDLTNQDLEILMSGLKKAFEQREKLAEIIEERMNGVVEEKRELLINNISKFLKLG